jgi:AcrR family transcriptional regulator
MAPSSVSSASRGPGRPREFDVDRAVDQAIAVFRERGYHATSIGDLRDAMGLTAGSIYKAFKDKRAVFIAALDRYMALRDARLAQQLETARTGRERLRRLLTLQAEMSSGQEGRRGCLVVGSAVELALFDPEIAGRITARFKRNELQIAQFIAEGQADRSIRATVDRQTAARVMLCILQGLRVVGKTGRSGDEMRAVVDTALGLLD